MKRALLTAALVFAAVPVSSASEPAGYAEEIQAWRSARLVRLQRPDGWLSLVGLHWVEPGSHTVGSDADNSIVLATGPARLGELVLADGSVTFAPAAGVGATANGQPLTGPVPVPADSSGAGVLIGFNQNKASFQVIERGGRFGLRVRDAEAPTLTGFHGIDAYPVDASFRFDARFEAHPAGRTIDIVNVIGMTDAMPNPGVVVFERDGQEYRLEAVDEGDGELFLIFGDRSNRKDTYGAGRFVYAPAPVDGRTVLDFNVAYNPPCAFTAYATCPLPPPENRLDLAVAAGEKRYHHE